MKSIVAVLVACVCFAFSVGLRADDKFIYLTFDDGPLATTDDCLAVLKDMGIKGTFFMVGSYMTTQFRKNQVKAVKNDGHLHGNHSHASSNYGNSGKTNTQWLADFKSCDSTTATIRGDNASTKHKHARLPRKTLGVRAKSKSMTGTANVLPIILLQTATRFMAGTSNGNIVAPLRQVIRLVLLLTCRQRLRMHWRTTQQSNAKKSLSCSTAISSARAETTRQS